MKHKTDTCALRLLARRLREGFHAGALHSQFGSRDKGNFVCPGNLDSAACAEPVRVEGGAGSRYG